MKFRKGDRVRIVANTSGHYNEIGSTTMIVSVDASDNVYNLENGYWAYEFELELADAKPTLPYGCELICKEMEVSDYEDFSKSRIEFVVFKDRVSYVIIDSDGDCVTYRHARPIDHKKKETKAKIEKLEAQILELKKELNGISD